MEACATGYLKKWLGNRSLRAMNVDFLYHPSGLNFKSLRQIAMEARSGLIVDCTLSSDEAAKEAANQASPQQVAEAEACLEQDPAAAKKDIVLKLCQKIGLSVLAEREESVG